MMVCPRDRSLVSIRNNVRQQVTILVLLSIITHLNRNAVVSAWRLGSKVTTRITSTSSRNVFDSLFVPSSSRRTVALTPPKVSRSSVDISMPIKPTLVVGATGQVGRRVVRQLLGQNLPVRALVRNASKAQELFGTATGFVYPPLEIVIADVAYYDNATVAQQLDSAVLGCGSIISVSGAFRLAKLTDFLPWRLWNTDVSSWADRGHPYFANYKAQEVLVGLAQTHGVSRFVRLTGRYTRLSVFSLIFAVLASRNNQYHFLCEQCLQQSKVPYVILRPGGLAMEPRNSSTTFLQVKDRVIFPAPSRVGRDDVATLAVLATDPNLLPVNENYELAVRWVGDGIKPRPQGVKEDGCETAHQCLDSVRATGPRAFNETTQPLPTPALAVGAVVYMLFALSIKLLLFLVGKILKFLS